MPTGSSDASCPPGPLGNTLESLESLSEEELLAYELAEDDLDLELDEEEEEEWRRYDEEVERMRQIQSVLDDTSLDTVLDDASRVANGTSATSSSQLAERLAEDDEVSSLLAAASDQSLAEALATLQSQLAQVELQKQALQMVPQQVPAQQMELAMEPQEVASGAAPSGWAPGLSQGSSFFLPAKYEARLAEAGTGIGIVVSNKLGPKTVVLLCRVPNQPELLPLLSETFRAQRVRILRGWMEAKDGDEMDIFEVCDAKTDEPLSKEAVARVERAIMQAVRAPTARQVLLEIDDQVPRLDAFYGLPVSAQRAPPLAAARGALVDAPFRVSEATDLGRALVFRGELEEGVEASQALEECQRRLCNVPPGFDKKEWDCHLVTGKSGPLLVLLPTEDLEEALGPRVDNKLIFFLSLGITVVCAQAAAPVVGRVLPPVGALVLSILGAAELARRGVASNSGLKLSPPLLLPSPALGTYGACSRPEGTVPNAIVQFDLASAAIFSAFTASLVLITLGLLMPPSATSCAWVNPQIFPHVLRQLIDYGAELNKNVCVEAPAGTTALVPASPALIAGCFGALTAALNTLPLGRLDGASLALAVGSDNTRDVLLPSAAFLLLGSTMLDTSADALFPLILSFCLFTFGVRSQVVPQPVFRDNISKPWDTNRRSFGIFLFTLAGALLTPTVVLDLVDALQNLSTIGVNVGGSLPSLQGP